MKSLLACLLGAVVLALSLGAPALAADLVPYRARYNLSLQSTGSSSGVVGAGGVMLDEWDETCSGWTEQEHFFLRLQYGDQDPGNDRLDTFSNFVSWEAKDGKRFQFELRQAATDKPFEDIKGRARAGAPGRPGSAEFTRPDETVLPLPPGTIFPAGHTRLLVARAEAGDQVVTRNVFDGSDVESAGQITAVIGPKLAPGADEGKKLPDSPLLKRPSWWVRLAFFPPADLTAEGAVDPPAPDQVPDYEESVRLLDNGVTEDMLFDYGDYVIHGKLERIEALPRPHC
ncbi:MAG TPA: DUF1849 family protein [Stellaceae bacterium]|jgi:hypothetical protein|nr:DUF1849 family protein [Stellaceae bacterium]